MELKTFKTLEEQVQILRSKNMVINDEHYAKEVLLRENYFFLHGYRYPFLKSKDDRFYINGTTFEELYSLFLFDRTVRNLIFKNVLIIENNVKSIFSYQLSKKYGYKEKDYLNPRNFNTSKEKRKQVNDLLGKMKRQMQKNITTHSATMHYVDNYGYVPLWILVKVLSFGIVAELFSILKKEDQYDIVDIYELDIDVFFNYLTILSNYRNLCAHEDIVFDHKTERAIPDTEYHNKLKIFKMDDEYIYGKNDMFAVVIIFKYLLSKDNFRLMMKEIEYEIDKLDGRIDTIPIQKVLDYMGFPKNYLEIVEM